MFHARGDTIPCTMQARCTRSVRRWALHIWTRCGSFRRPTWPYGPSYGPTSRPAVQPSYCPFLTHDLPRTLSPRGGVRVVKPCTNTPTAPHPSPPPASPAPTSAEGCSSEHTVAPTTGHVRSPRRRCFSAPAARAASSASMYATSDAEVASCRRGGWRAAQPDRDVVEKDALALRQRHPCSHAWVRLPVAQPRVHCYRVPRSISLPLSTSPPLDSGVGLPLPSTDSWSAPFTPPHLGKPFTPTPPHPTLSALRSSVAVSRLLSSPERSERCSTGLAMRSTLPSRRKSVKPASWWGPVGRWVGGAVRRRVGGALTAPMASDWGSPGM